MKDQFDLLHAQVAQMQMALEDLRTSLCELENRFIQTEYTYLPDHPIPGEMLVIDTSTEDSRSYIVHFHKDTKEDELKKQVEENFR